MAEPTENRDPLRPEADDQVWSESDALEIWQRFCEPLLSKIRRKLGGRRREADEDDIAQAAFHSFFRRLRNGEFTELGDRESIWRLLLTIANRKAMNQVRNQRRDKRGGGNVAGESIFIRDPQLANSAGFDSLSKFGLTPELYAESNETIDLLFSQLDDQAQQIVLHRLEGYTNSEIAVELGCSRATVERRVSMIRTRWRSHLC